MAISVITATHIDKYKPGVLLSTFDTLTDDIIDFAKV